MAENAEALQARTARHGYFDAQSREYVIIDPMTPLPWINYLGSADFHSIVSNTGGGYSFYRDAKLRRLTRYRYDSVPLDSVGKYLYIVDGGTVWNAGWRPTRTCLDSYECRHGLGYTRFLSSKNGLRAELLTFVADEHDVELQRLTLTNTGKRPKQVRLFSYVEWCQWNAADDGANLQRNLSLAEAVVSGNTICHMTGYRERRSHYAYHTVNREIDGYDTDRGEFLGPYGEIGTPLAVVEGRSQNSRVSGWWPIASLSVSADLQPGQAQEFVFATGYAENPADAKWHSDGRPNIDIALNMQARIADPTFVKRCYKAQCDTWHDYLDAFQAITPEARLDALVNTWNPYQCMVTFQLARSASLFETGSGRGIGFRDSNQDCLGVVHLVPDRVRRRLRDLAATQQSDGSAYHQYQPLTKTGNNEIGGGFNDDPLWLVLSVAEYIRETGELDILDDVVPFEDTPDTPSTLHDHLRASLGYTMQRLGPHGLPLIGRADWNDCLNLNAHSTNPDESFQTGPMRSSGKAESVMIAGLYVLAAREYVRICEWRDEAAAAEPYLASIDAMSDAVKAHGWDGNWFLRAYDHEGNAVGSHTDTEGSIFVEPQGFCGMARIGADAGMIDKALASVAERLACEFGLQLLEPPFRSYRPELGEISTYLPGYKENGAVFCHNNPWVIIAEALNGNGDRAMQYLRAIAPTYQVDTARRATEPYVYAQMVAGTAAARPGEAKNSWLTGTASWSYVAITHYILGVRPDINGLRIEPCIPSDWDGYYVSRTYRGARYNIRVTNPRRACCGVRSIIADGRAVSGNLVPIAPAGTTVEVTVELA